MKTTGYWGYTGFNGDSVNISNNGFGMTSVQGRYVLPLFERIQLTFAAGWFVHQSSEAATSEQPPPWLQ